MLKLLISSRKVVKLALIVIIFNLGGSTIIGENSIVTADWGDVVNVNYSLWEDAEHTIEVQGNIDINLPPIYLSTGSIVPQDVLALFPTATASIILKFKEAIINMEENETKDFKINSEDAYNDGDMYYRIILLKIRYDQSSTETTSITTVPSSETTITTITETKTTTSKITNTTTIPITITTPELTSGSTVFVSVLILFSVVLLRRKNRLKENNY